MLSLGDSGTFEEMASVPVPFKWKKLAAWVSPAVGVEIQVSICALGCSLLCFATIPAKPNASKHVIFSREPQPPTHVSSMSEYMMSAPAVLSWLFAIDKSSDRHPGLQVMCRDARLKIWPHEGLCLHFPIRSLTRINSNLV